MKIFADYLIGFIAIEHIGFLILEMFLWTHRIGRKVFQQTAEAAESSRKLAANQGLYNGFLAAGLIWGLGCDDWSVKIFFTACVLIAGIFGGLTVKRSILVVQALPALIVLILLYATR